MNTRFFPLILLTSLLLMTNGCNKEDADLTYEIIDIQWVDNGLDADEDGFVTSREVKFFISLAEFATRDVRIKIYYKLSETLEYIFYHSTTFEGVTKGTENEVTLTLGLNPELPKGHYDFLIEIYELNSERLEASTEIKNTLFERLITDRNYNMKVHWENQYDYDFDGVPRSADLYVDVNLTNNDTREIKVEVQYRNMLQDEDFTAYFESDYFEITANQPEDAILVPTGVFPDTLITGLYSFKIIVMERNVFSPVLIFDEGLSDELKLVPFESDYDDIYHYSVNMDNTRWINIIDVDTDGFCQAKVLRLDLDIEKEETVQVKAKMYRRAVGEDDYKIIDSTGFFSITGKTISDTIWFPITNATLADTVKMPHGWYDLMLSIFEVLPGDTIEFGFAIDSVDNTFFRNQQFELFEEDTL